MTKNIHQEVFKAELKRISGCIPLEDSDEKLALKYLDEVGNYSIKGVFCAIQKVVSEKKNYY